MGDIRVAIARKFFKSDFANMEGVITEQDYKTEVNITRIKRRLIVSA